MQLQVFRKVFSRVSGIHKLREEAVSSMPLGVMPWDIITVGIHPRMAVTAASLAGHTPFMAIGTFAVVARNQQGGTSASMVTSQAEPLAPPSSFDPALILSLI
jgi:hypothetical protein